MKKLRILLALATLFTSLFVGSVKPAAAAGDCLDAVVRLYDSATFSGINNRYCYGQNDADIESEPGNVMGPLWNDTYANDFLATETQSGVSSATFAGNHDRIVCIYNYKSYGGSLLGSLGNGVTGITFGSGNNLAGSFRWYTANFCPA